MKRTKSESRSRRGRQSVVILSLFKLRVSKRWYHQVVEVYRGLESGDSGHPLFSKMEKKSLEECKLFVLLSFSRALYSFYSIPNVINRSKRVHAFSLRNVNMHIGD